MLVDISKSMNDLAMLYSAQPTLPPAVVTHISAWNASRDDALGWTKGVSTPCKDDLAALKAKFQGQK